MSDPDFDISKNVTSTKITVNGVTYDDLDAMPPEVRRVYEGMLTRFPKLTDRDGDGIPEVIQGDFGPLHYSASIRKKIVVNGTTYEGEESMPPDVRQKFADAMRAARSSDPNVKKNEIKVSFQLTGPGLSFGKARDGASKSTPAIGLVPAPPAEPQTPTPIGPTADNGRLRLAITLGALAAGGALLWLLVRTR